MKTLKINPPVGYEIDKEQSTFENIVFKPLNKCLPKTWGELGVMEDYFATKEQVEACNTLAKLSQLMKVYNDGWIPDWSNESTKYVIMFQGDDIIRESWTSYQHFLAFKTIKIRDEFLENFRDLILTAKPLL